MRRKVREVCKRNRMTDVKDLLKSISQYEQQLAQVKQSLSITKNASDREELYNLQSQIEELIELTKESLQSVKDQNVCEEIPSTNFQDKSADPWADEYALFQKELQEASQNSENLVENDKPNEPSNNIEDELRALEGLKCRAPRINDWGGSGYYNAMICSVDKTKEDNLKSLQDIKVKVFFINPTHKDMLPCPYFLNGSCKFQDDQCHYSHGEVVLFSSLQEYREPDYSSIKTGSKVLMKQDNQLWYRGIILKMPNKDDANVYRIKLESNGTIMEKNVQDLLPLENADCEVMGSSDESDCESSKSATGSTLQQFQKVIVNENLLKPVCGVMGDWEKHTRGMGSKLMARMGYIAGTGLGKRADGRIEPVEVSVMPVGKSLDHCMELRELSGDSKDIFSMEKRIRKQQQQIEKQAERQYHREKERQKHNVFNFLNSTLGDKRNDDALPCTSKSQINLKTETAQNLNVASFEIGENIAKLEKESLKLKSSLVRHAKGSPLYNSIITQYNDRQKQLINLRASEKSIADEQKQRRNKAKLSIF
ncbi:zinc finger CCCH-type with G patch domain-containing protein isoform X2 [Prorops nasuta]|uniref:zinc finger CCCH-type with G patch domain-containing protein isoform X2 n=1 Tax=Prorops nasuta TaxID=863751 RepID=UPI0034CFAA55